MIEGPEDMDDGEPRVTVLGTIAWFVLCFTFALGCAYLYATSGPEPLSCDATAARAVCHDAPR